MYTVAVAAQLSCSCGDPEHGGYAAVATTVAPTAVSVCGKKKRISVRLKVRLKVSIFPTVILKFLIRRCVL